jgi:mannose-1-phosphate guanylyltransferase/mannose-6-phosphate isomerase
MSESSLGSNTRIIIPVILSGGSGTRLWPLSRKQYPKQYLPLAGELTMLQATIQRLVGVENIADPIIVCNIEHRFLVAEQLHKIGVENPVILLEPIGKNTAPAIAAAAHYVIENYPDNEKVVGNKISLAGKCTNYQLLVLSADHVIQEIHAFHQAIKVASKQADEGKLVTFGVPPTQPHTGYGYMKIDTPFTSMDGGLDRIDAVRIEKFKEKPSQKIAEQYIKDGCYLWNSGMFLFQAKQLVKELSIYAQDIVKATQLSIKHATKDLDFIRLDKKSFSSIPNVSIDYALMEKTKKAVVVRLDAGWNDIGSWTALYEVGISDDNKNVVKGDVHIIDSTNSYIHADHHMIAAIGIDNLIIVDTADATLITTKEKAQEVKSIVDYLQQHNRCEDQLHRKVYRPWGWYDSIDKGNRFQVKRICVSPGARLSLQKHFHRAEHWVVVSGVAKITNGDKVEELRENQSTYIPVGTVHRLENPSKLPLEMIEVQSGSYLGEDDIERFEDSYGRD